ncbi:MAG TPA: hypothetical protein DCS24_09505 [Erythrobacter sp.]|nr:hypothetical protein [Erythrobacter sp.]
MDRAIQELIDKQAIADVLQRYSRTLDWLDEDAQASCYWPDADIDYGFYTGDAEQFLPIVMEIERGSDRRWHMLGAPLVKFGSSGSASSECYGIFAGAKRQDDGSLAGNLYGGRYLDEWEKRDAGNGEEWRISKRLYIVDWHHPLENQPGFEPNPEFPLPTFQIDKSGHPNYREL